MPYSSMTRVPLLFVLLLAPTAHFTPRLTVTILYESLCPDSYNFITSELHPVWDVIKEFVNLKFVPFGKSFSSKDGAFFKCQHGPKECEGNRVMSCALNSLLDQSLQVEYVNCFMDIYRNAPYDNQEFGQKCAIKVGLDWEKIRKCYETQDGTQLQLQAEQETLKTKPSFIPTILYDDEFDQYLQDASLDNFKGVVCSVVKQKYNVECNV